MTDISYYESEDGIRFSTVRLVNGEYEVTLFDREDEINRKEYFKHLRIAEDVAEDWVLKC